MRTSLHTALSAYPHDLMPSFPQTNWSKKEQVSKAEAAVSSMAGSEAMCHHLSNVLLVVWVSPIHSQCRPHMNLNIRSKDDWGPSWRLASTARNLIIPILKTATKAWKDWITLLRVHGQYWQIWDSHWDLFIYKYANTYSQPTAIRHPKYFQNCKALCKPILLVDRMLWE